MFSKTILLVVSTSPTVDVSIYIIALLPWHHPHCRFQKIKAQQPYMVHPRTCFCSWQQKIFSDLQKVPTTRSVMDVFGHIQAKRQFPIGCACILFNINYSLHSVILYVRTFWDLNLTVNWIIHTNYGGSKNYGTEFVISVRIQWYYFCSPTIGVVGSMYGQT